MAGEYPMLKDAEPIYLEGNETGILISHGFTGTTQSMRPLAESYSDAGYTVCAPRLAGHGTHYEDMENSNYENWIASVEEGYNWLKERCDNIFVTGLSMGGTLACYLAENHPEIKGIVTINPAVDIPDMTEAAGNENLPRYLDAIGSDIKKPDTEELAYEKTPVASIKQIVMLMAQVKNNLDQITCPVLMFVSDEDHVVPPLNTTLINEAIQSEQKAIIQLHDSYHVATLDNDQEKIIENSLRFFKEYK